MSSAVERLIEADGLPADYRKIVDRFWRPLSEEIAERAADNADGKPLVVGINGAQGSGKSTLCKFLEVLLVEHNQIGVTLALDDLYLTRAERLEAAADHHPLFATRGVPGTHDVEMGMAILDRLLAGKPADLPVFDKACDDRRARTRRIEGRVDVILFEGWCVGAAPQPAADLAEPINQLEREEDADGVWRREVNRRLATDYAELFGRIDCVVMLKVSDFTAVRAHRRLQEEKLAAANPAGPAVMDEAELDLFLAHYQRLTEWMLAEMPARADIVIEIGADQKPTRVSTKAGSL
jgi:D-glycerate 3-kinase